MSPAGRVATAIIAILALIPAASAAELKIAEDAESFTLDNGLEVVVIPDHRAPIVTHMVWYKAGAIDEDPGKSGIAHFLEHLMFKGTSTYSEGEFSATVAEIGGNENAFTTDDVTVYHQTVARQHLGLLMSFEADRMANLLITDEDVLPERQVVLEERSSRTDNNPGAQLSEAMSAALYQNSHYGIPTIGWAHEIAALSREDAMAFYDRYYTPNNAILVVAGDVTTEEVRALAEETYGKVARRAEPPKRIPVIEPPPLAARTVTLADPQVTQPSLLRSYLTPSHGTAEGNEPEALDVLAEIVGGGTTSRLYRDLIIGKGVATAAGAYYRGTAREETALSIYAVPRGDVSLDELAAEIDAVIAEVVANGVTEDELVSAKRRMIANAVYAQDNHSALARVFGSALAIGQSLDDVKNWPAAVDAVTTDDVLAVARRYLDLRRSVTGYLTGAPEDTRS